MLFRLILRIAVLGLASALLLMALQLPALLFVYLGLAALYKARKRRPSGSFGTACLSNLRDLAFAGMLSGRGLPLGRASLAEPPTLSRAVGDLFSNRLPPDAATRLFLAALMPKRGDSGLVHVPDHVHLAAFAPTGRGKGVSLMGPILLSYIHSMIIVDIKGELVRLSKVHRQDQFLNRCVVIDPFNISWHGGDSFNILDLIARDSPFLLDFCRAIGDALVVSTGREESPHWNEMAAQVLAFFTAYVASALPPEYRHLGTVRHIVCSRTRFVETIQLMKESNACGGKLRQAGEQLEWLIDRELASVMASVQRHTSWMDSPAVESVLTRSSFNPRELRDGKLSIYLVLPPDKLESHAALMRLWIDGLLRALMMDGADESSPVLALIDEAGHIGPIKSLQTAVTLGRGFGIRLFFVFQSLGQVQECYKNHAQTFIENIDTQIYFGTTAYATAEEISKRIGEYTLLVESRGSSSGYSHQRGREESTSFSSTSSVNTSEIGRRVFKPEEILTMGERAALVFHRNLSVIPVQLVRHYEDPAFRDGGTGDEHTRPVLARLARGMIAAAAALLFVVAVVWAALVLPTAGVVPQRPQQDAPGRMPHLGYGQPVPQPAGTPYGWPANTPSTPGGMGGPAGGMRFTPSRPGRWPVNSPSTIGGMGGPAGGMR